MQLQKQFRAHEHGVAFLESFEARMMLSAPYDFAGVGVRYDAGPAIFLAEGTIAEDDSITGTMRLATLAGVQAPGPIDWVGLNRMSGGAFTFDTRSGFDPYASQSGVQFIREERRIAGSFIGRDAEGEVRDYAVLTQPFVTSDFNELLGSGFELQLLHLAPSGELETVGVNVTRQPQTPDILTFEYLFSSGTVTDAKTILSIAGGRIELDSGEVLFITDRNTGVIMADLDNADGIVGIGTGRVRLQRDIPNGRYFGAVVVTSTESAEFFGLSASDLGADGSAVADVVIELNLIDRTDRDGVINTFSIYRRAEFDAGLRTPIVSGHWVSPEMAPVVPVESVRLTADDGTMLLLRHNYTRTMSFDELTPPQGQAQELFGVVTGGELFGHQLVEFLPHVENGRPIVYQDVRFLDDLLTPAPYSIDLVNNVGGETIRGELLAWRGHDNRTHFFAGLSQSGDVQMWRFSFDYGWTYANLTQSLQGARPIAGDLFAAEFETDVHPTVNSNQQFLAGFDADGNFVVYHQFFTEQLEPEAVWDFVDAEADGFADGATIPGLDGPLTGWITGWDGANFAGIDSTGQLWVVWWAPGLAEWHVTNLSEVAEVPTLVGDPTAVRTAWDTFHIHALDASGNVIATWWAAAFDNWHVDNLTELFDGPTLEVGTLTSNFSVNLDNINIVGRDSEGQAAIYWWNAATGWNINSLSASVAPQFIPLTPWTLTSTGWSMYPEIGLHYSQSLLGRNAEGDLVRLTWLSHAADDWIFQNVTEMSVPYFG